MSDRVLGLTRNQLQAMTPNARALRALEQMLKQVGDLVPADIITLNRLIQEASLDASEAQASANESLAQLGGIAQDAAINAGSADAKATQALDALRRIANSLELLTLSPVIQNNNSTVTDYVDFRDNGWLPAYRIGRVWFGPTGTLEVAMGNGNITQQVGEEFFRYGKASSAISDTNLQLVYKTGVVGASGVITFAPAVAGITDPDQILGIATESIAANAFGRITTMGVVHGINTTGSVYGETWADNDDIWYNPVTGGLTKVKPSAPNIKLQVGTVINAGGGGSGSFSVKLGSSSSLGGTDSNVQFSSLASGNVLIYDATAGYWKNALLTAGTNVAITNGPGSITIAVAGAAPTGAAGGVLSGTYPNPGFAVDMATQAELDAHTSATGTAVHGLGTVATLAADTDGTLAANSDSRVPTQKAVKTYVDNAVTGLLDLKGAINCSTNPNYPAASKGDAYYVNVAGKIGGASGVTVEVGDMIVASADNAGGTQAAVGSFWFILEHNLTGALLAANNLSDVANVATSRTNLGATTLGANLFTISNPSAVSFPRFNADNTVSALSAADARIALGAAPVTKTADFTVAATDVWLINNKSGSTCTVTLPAASSNTGRSLTLQNWQAQTLVSASANVVPLGGSAAGTAILAASAGDWATLVSDGTNWVVMQAATNNNLLLE